MLVFQTANLTSGVKGVTARQQIRGSPPVPSVGRLTARSLLQRAGCFEMVLQFAILSKQEVDPESGGCRRTSTAPVGVNALQIRPHDYISGCLCQSCQLHFPRSFAVPF